MGAVKRGPRYEKAVGPLALKGKLNSSLVSEEGRRLLDVNISAVDYDWLLLVMLYGFMVRVLSESVPMCVGRHSYSYEIDLIGQVLIVLGRSNRALPLVLALPICF